MTDKYCNNNHSSTQQELIKVAEQLFIKKGYKATSISDVIKAADISKGGFYHHFSSKNDLLTAVVDRQMSLMAGGLREVVDNQGLTALEKLKQYIFFGMATSELASKLYSDLFFNLKDPVVQQEIFNRARKHILPLFVKIIEQGIKEGTIKTETPYETVEMLIMIKQGITGLPEEVLRDKEKLMKYFVAARDIMEKSLGIEPGFLDRELGTFLKEKMQIIN